MTKKILIVLLIVILATGIGGFIFFNKSQKKLSLENYQEGLSNNQNQTESQILNSEQEEHPVKDETIDWNVFTSSNNAFSFRYPVEWKVEEKSGMVGIFYSLAGKTPAEEMSLPAFEISETAIYVTIKPQDKELLSKAKGINGVVVGNTIESYADFLMQSYSDNRYNSHAVFSKRQNINVGNKTGIKLEFTFKDTLIKHYIIVVESNGVWYDINYDIRNSGLMVIFDKILLTFLFK